ncbi:hypothetical protein HELRODRAFT_161231 [Helobdella robusta]|uniref:Uncharacterized protein n=1 Tax=Helobdella robusta TaxID=6412 RepID=T1ER86_HELRO|nr:hypothetical protein HELRODRAFT_161231 [Helobdella robusta]ESO02010.1 hypothetical protein HELRODRAFT_161231 [Helobdella robusta]
MEIKWCLFHWELQVVLEWPKDNPKWSGNFHTGITGTKCTRGAVKKTPSLEIPLICGDLHGHAGDKANGFHGQGSGQIVRAVKSRCSTMTTINQIILEIRQGKHKYQSTSNLTFKEKFLKDGI